MQVTCRAMCCRTGTRKRALYKQRRCERFEHQASRSAARQADQQTVPVRYAWSSVKES